MCHPLSLISQANKSLSIAQEKMHSTTQGMEPWCITEPSRTVVPHPSRKICRCSYTKQLLKKLDFANLVISTFLRNLLYKRDPMQSCNNGKVCTGVQERRSNRLDVDRVFPRICFEAQTRNVQ